MSPKYVLTLFIPRTSTYDRERGTSDIKKRLDDFPSKRDDSYSSKRDSYKSSRDDFKRELDLPSRHSSSTYSASGSSRIDASSSIGKERYTERSTSDYRAAASRNDDRDSRNGSSKPRYLDPPAESRFNERPSVASSNATVQWNSGASHQAFGLNTDAIWAEKQPESGSASAWRGLDDNRYNRFANNDRKPVAIPTTQFIDPSVRSNQFIGSNSSILPGGAGRFANRYDNGRF